jgi:hypothetical protein
MRSRLSVVFVGVLAAVGCSSSNATQDSALCASIVTDLAGSGLQDTPTREQARQAGLHLDRRLTQVAKPAIHEAVIALHTDLHRIEVLRKNGDAAGASKASADARSDVARLARACGQPTSHFVGP